MKACIIQPFYSTDYSRSEELFEKQLEMLDACDESVDLIVMPEAGDVPCLASTVEQYKESYREFGPRYLKKLAETAERCHALVFANATFVSENGRERNTTYVFDRTGNIIGHYYKKHLTPREVDKRKLDCAYTFQPSEPVIITIEGVRYAFLTCYDFYFYEAFAEIARYSPDIIIGCSHQRSDTHAALEMFTRFCAYHTNAYVVRSTVTLDENGSIGGCSMIVAPDSTVLVNLGSKIGMASYEFDPHKKYLKPAGFGNPDAAHYEYIDAGRRPWQYRPGGPAMVPGDSIQQYPRVCAHRGLCTGTPENSLAALGAAVALGADEVEFDIRPTKDRVLVLSHDPGIPGYPPISELTLEELRKIPVPVKDGKLEGITVVTFEEALRKFTCQTVINLHVKTPDNVNPIEEWILLEIARLLHKYDCEKHVYLMCGNDAVQEQFKKYMPGIRRCMGAGIEKDRIVERAIRLGCEKVQFYHGHMSEENIRLAKEHGIICNYFYTDDPNEAVKLIKMGIDTVLTNNYYAVNKAVKDAFLKAY